ncbi:hypothetical protein GCM10010145_56010 [Streptomyces ruber]|uniref:Uncharacterized protein n=2 Tax=Streptomyces TaxID=1883 RepID=A0A918EVQ6_9ACTN|nr:N-acetylmuramoyl-L-alanine amidase [Streptomyces ruber]GGQ79085.1 hypothetical protein GCM10010145_56010 [Streptomyces ruber]
MIHHTVTSGSDRTVRLCHDGRPGLPGPLPQGVITKDGRVHLIGYGRANHAGLGDDDVLLMGFGLPAHDPDPATTGTLTNSKISLHTSTPEPALHGGWNQRMTWARAEKATRVAINSVVFRSSGQNLTTPGTYIKMTSRFLEPALLALGILAVRGRIKR